MAVGAHDLYTWLDELEFVAVAENKAIGLIAAIPTAVTVLTSDPLALMFAFHVHPEASAEAGPALPSLDDVPDDRATISCEDGMVWLTLYNLSGLTPVALRGLVEKTAGMLAADEWAPCAGCLRCGRLEGAQLMCVDGRATRLCPDCLGSAAREQQELEARLNRPSFMSTLSMPIVAGSLAAGWAVLWTVLDFVVEWLQIRVVEINEITGLLIMGALAGLGYLLGWPLGTALRRSIAVRRAPVAIGIVLVLAAIVAGEVGYVALRLFRWVGVFDVQAAAGLLGKFIASYSGFWIFNKLLLTASIATFCCMSAKERHTVPLKV